MYDKSIMLVDFMFIAEGYEVEGKVALFFERDCYLPMTDDEILEEIKRQYGYDAVQILHGHKKNA